MLRVGRRMQAMERGKGMMVLNATVATGMVNAMPLPLLESATQHDKVAERGIPPHEHKALAHRHKGSEEGELREMRQQRNH